MTDLNKWWIVSLRVMGNTFKYTILIGHTRQLVFIFVPKVDFEAVKSDTFYGTIITVYLGSHSQTSEFIELWSLSLSFCFDALG